MAVTPVASEKFFANCKMECYLHAPAAATTAQTAKSGATTETWKAMRDYEGIAVQAMWVTDGGSGGLILCDLYAATDSSGSDVVLVKGQGTANASTAVACDARGDNTCIEITAEELAQLGTLAGKEYTHVSAWFDCTHADDEVAFTYVRYGAKRPASGLTAETIA